MSPVACQTASLTELVTSRFSLSWCWPPQKCAHMIAWACNPSYVPAHTHIHIHTFTHVHTCSHIHAHMCMHTGVQEDKATWRLSHSCLVCSCSLAHWPYYILYLLAHPVSKSLDASLFLKYVQQALLFILHDQEGQPHTLISSLYKRLLQKTMTTHHVYYHNSLHLSLPTLCFAFFLSPRMDHFYCPMQCAWLLCPLLTVSPCWNVSPTRPERLAMFTAVSRSGTLEALRKHMVGERMSPLSFQEQ